MMKEKSPPKGDPQCPEMGFCVDETEALIIGSESILHEHPHTERTVQGQECILLSLNPFSLQNYVDSFPFPLAFQIRGPGWKMKWWGERE